MQQWEIASEGNNDALNSINKHTVLKIQGASSYSVLILSPLLDNEL